MFWPTAIAKSPRIEPVVASSGLVAPITWRAALMASSPSSTSATIGPEVMKVTSSPKNGRSVVLGVVLLGQVLGHGHVLGRDDLQALALEARDDLPGQAARERVRLDKDQSSLHRGLPTRIEVRASGRRSARARSATLASGPSASVRPDGQRRLRRDDVSPVAAGSATVSSGSGRAASAATVD